MQVLKQKNGFFVQKCFTKEDLITDSNLQSGVLFTSVRIYIIHIGNYSVTIYAVCYALVYTLTGVVCTKEITTASVHIDN